MPHGQTSFRHEASSSTASIFRFIEATDPLAGTEHLEFQWETPFGASRGSADPRTSYGYVAFVGMV